MILRIVIVGIAVVLAVIAARNAIIATRAKQQPPTA
jgi:hypothetical protein